MFSGEKIWILDGAMGTMIQKYGLSEEDFHGRPFSHIPSPLAGNNECLNLTRPDIIAEIHRQYIEAGADIIETNTFSANSISQQEYGCSGLASEMARAGAGIAREEADRAMERLGRKIHVAGSVGPTSKSLSLAPDITDPAFRPYSFDDMAAAYKEQIGALIEGGADIIQIETCFDALNTKAAIYAVEQLNNEGVWRPAFGKHTGETSPIPVIVSVSVADRSGRTLTGQTIEAFYTSVRHYPLAAFGLNCSLGASDLTPLLKEVASWAGCPVIFYPNAGLPNEMGGYDQTPEQMAAEIAETAAEGLVNIAGGCCGTTPEHIRAIADAVRDIPARKALHQTASGKSISLHSSRETDAVGQKHFTESGELTVSGLETVHIDLAKSNFINIGERTNVAGSRKFARLIASGDYQTAIQIAADQIDSGASVIDINMDDAMLDSTGEMERFCRYISNDPATAKAALMIDSSHWETILAGLKNAQGKSIVNSISLKEGEEAFISKARTIRELGAAMVVMAFDEEGQATTFSRKTGICARAYRLLTGAGIPPEDIIFDANVLSIGTGIEEHARYGIDFIEAVRWIKANLPGARTSGGISNLSFAFRGNNAVREAMHSAFLYHAIQAGLDMAIVNPGMLMIYDRIEHGMLRCVEDVIFDRDPEATERLIDKAREVMEEKESARSDTSDTGGQRKLSDSRNRESGKTGQESGRAGNNGRQSTGQSGKSGSGISGTLETVVEDRLCAAIVSGRTASLEADLMEALTKYGGKAVEIIEGPLMSGMKEVGELFGSGKMFLPQVVKSAGVMRNAVTILEPYMPADGLATSEAAAPMTAGMSDGTGNGPAVPDGNIPAYSRPKIVIATVKGDVHDIGKNITGTVLTCNGFNVIDLGVMVDRDTILEAAAREQADIIAVSGLITPSLFQMEELCREMSRRGMDTPLFIGGATTSALHTAVKLAPLYDHVFYGADASASAVMAKRYIMDRDAFEAEEHAGQERIRELYHSRDNSPEKDSRNPVRSAGPAMTVPSDTENAEGRTSRQCSPSAASATAFPSGTYIGCKEAGFTDIPAKEIPVREVLPYFDWRMFLTIFGIRYTGTVPDSDEIRRLEADGRAVLDEMTAAEKMRTLAEERPDDSSILSHDSIVKIADKKPVSCRIMLAARFFDACSRDEGISFDGHFFPMFRQEQKTDKATAKANLSLCDFVPTESSGKKGNFGMFAISVSRDTHTRTTNTCSCYGQPYISTGHTGPSDMDYQDMVRRAVRLTLAEAASVWLDRHLEEYLPGNMKIVKPAAGYASCPDHTLKRDILELLPDSDRLGIRLTESCAMIPDASICGLIFAHPDATYPEIRRISRQQYEDYVRKRGMDQDTARRFLSHLLD